MKPSYSIHAEEIKKKIEADKIEAAGTFLWNNFLENFKARREGINRPFIEKLFKQMLANQGANNLDNNLFAYMSDNDVFKAATELYVYIQLTAKGGQREFWPKALAQSNPYVLRYDVLELHNRMHGLTAGQSKLQAQLYVESLENLKHLTELQTKYPAFAHFLMGYTHFTLAMGATAEFQQKHWKEAYKEFLLCEKTENINPKASTLVNLGQGVFKDMPFENLESVKAQIEQHLDSTEMNEVRLSLGSLKI